MVTISKASQWVSERIGREVTPANIAYLINYGRIRGVKNDGGATVINIHELESYYKAHHRYREMNFKRHLGDNLNWKLSFQEYKEAETTKHVHRLHPYKGKFIPQLVEYFIDSHTDAFKTEVIFQPKDIILDPFCGSGTTLVQANELNIHAIGVDISRFNVMIANLKLSRLSPQKIAKTASDIEQYLYPVGVQAREFETALLEKLKTFNNTYFPSSTYKRQVRTNIIDEATFGKEKETAFLPTYNLLLKRFNISTATKSDSGFLNKWYIPSIRTEIDMANAYINDRIQDPQLQDVMKLILSRTIRSCRATTHADLTTLRAPMLATYYCGKHGKICKPLFSMLSWWQRYTQDTVKRLQQFAALRTETQQSCVVGDARNIDLCVKLKDINGTLATVARQGKIRGIFSSPPYVGLINYHEQHAYAYELFNLHRNDAKEIGIMEKGTGRKAQEEYIIGVSDVLLNCRRFMMAGFDVLLVANDKFELYPDIAKRAKLRIVKKYERPVINRAEGNKGAYSESIFQMREI